ncbi:MAG: right-handed parallel beta-helix repeat-containing protein, partial [Candidatus Saccharibacteria bacterium]|nr:right-handed parallel beta-helix repeat-containing protein [Candidatus Saccharibacteria bacterium]
MIVTVRTNQVTAATSNQLNFQGRLLTASGDLVPDGNYHVEFKLYNASAVDGGETPIQGACTTNPGAVADEDCLWTETRTTGNLVSIQKGYYSVYLGSVTSLPNIDWSQDLYLSMNIGGSGGGASWDGEMTPRFKLTAVPYAFKASNVASSSTNAVSTPTDGVSITTGNALGATSNSGNITLDVGTATGTTGTISLGSANASALTLGRSGLTTTNGGNFTIQGGTSTLGTNAQAGSLVISDGSSNYGTIAVNATAGNYTYTIPTTTANDTFCLLSLSNCAGSGDIVQNGNSFTAAITIGTNDTYDLNFETNGTTRITVDDTTGNVNFTGSVTLAASQSLTVTGGNTASRPGSPTEGMIYFDSTTDSLLTYANGKWQSDRGEFVVVAASDSTQSEKDNADYVADGTADQTEINSALTDAAGGKVILLAGTYVADGTILIPNNTTLAGSGVGTEIQFDDIDATDNLIENSDTTTGTGVVIRDLKLNGRSDLNTAGDQIGVYFDNMGSSARSGGQLLSLEVVNFHSSGGGRSIVLNASNNNTISSILIKDSGHLGLLLQGSSENIITNNTITGSGYDAISLNTANDNIITDNIIYANGGGFTADASHNNIVSDNSIKNSVYIEFSSSDYNNFSNNIVEDNISGLYVGGTGNTVSNNTFVNNGDTTDNYAIILGADNSTVIGNVISDDSCTVTCYAIEIQSGTNNYLADNTYYTTAGTDQATINDAGTGTRYASQLTPAAVLQSGSSLIRANATTVLTGSIDPAASTAVVGVGTKFTTELQVGDRITVSAETRTVTAIAS